MERDVSRRAALLFETHRIHNSMSRKKCVKQAVSGRRSVSASVTLAVICPLTCDMFIIPHEVTKSVRGSLAGPRIRKYDNVSP